MKNASGIAALILGILSVFSIAGCVKAQHEYSQFMSYSNSSEGAVEGFFRGLQRGSQGDPFGAVLDIVSQERTLKEEASSSRFWAWIFVIATVISLVVYAGARATQPKPASNETTQAAPADFKHIVSCERCGQQLRVPSGKGRLQVRCPSCNHSFSYKSL